MNIGIIGYGVVGKAVEAGFENKCHIFIYDPAYQDMDDDKFCVSIRSVYLQSNIIFVGVPTPMTKVDGGPFNSKIIDSVMGDLYEAHMRKVVSDRNEESACVYPVIVIESAVIPSKIKEYLEKYPELRLVVSPEYLTENNPIEGFLEPLCRVLGGNEEDTSLVQIAFDLYSDCEDCKVGYCDAIAASLMKYMENSFLAMKVSFMNQFYDMLQSSGSETSWDQYAESFHIDPRMGNSHFKVPGPDDKRHWSGKCFPKDVNAIIYEAKKHGCDLSIMEAVWKYNLENREDKDWADIKGAVESE